jgi:C-terminal processing protease CtpA/Prc
MQENSINRLTIDWSAFRQRVNATAPANPATIPETYGAIGVALALLEDHHSFFVRPDGGFVANPNPRRACTEPAAPVPRVPDHVGYVKIGAFTGSGDAAQRFAESIQGQIRAADSVRVVGWIVDLRGNGGGNMWPMIAGVGPVLGDGQAGAFVTPTGAVTVWGYRDGSSYTDTSLAVAVPEAYRLLRPEPRVAVLTDCWVASSGEATTIAFKGRPGTRSFGTATFGLSTANSGFALPGGGQLVLTVSLMADRDLVPYGDVVPPDEVITDPARTVERAVEWLSAGTSFASARSLPPLLRAP